MGQESAPAMPEVDAWWGSYSLRLAVPWFLATILLSGILLGVPGFLLEPVLARRVLAVLFWLAAIAQALFWIYRIFGYNYRLTTHRLFKQRGLIRRKMWVMNLGDIKEVVVQPGLAHRFLGVGSIVVTTDAVPKKMILDGVPAADQVAEKILALSRACRSRSASGTYLASPAEKSDNTIL
jgi:uncharacterized membrane protein YdbT with pleckstrin-like domain